MSQPEQFDALILGSGQGGKLLAWHMARSGRRTATVERRWVGGSCPAVACMPSKNEIWSARVAHLAQTADRFGTVTGPVRTDMAKVRSRKQAMVEREIAFHMNAYKTSGAELIMGSGRFVAPKTIEVQLNGGGTRLLQGEHVFVNVGSHAAIPDVPGLEGTRPLTHIEALELDSLPPHLIVLGGGYTGLELARRTACKPNASGRSAGLIRPLLPQFQHAEIGTTVGALERFKRLGNTDAIEAAGDEHQVRAICAGGPCRQVLWRMHDVLGGVHDHRAGVADVEKPLDAQHVRPVRVQQHAEPDAKGRPVERRTKAKRDRLHLAVR